MRIVNIKSAAVAAMLAIGMFVTAPIVDPVPAQASIFKKFGRAVSKTVKHAERTAGHVVKDVGKTAGHVAKGVGKTAGGAAKGIGKAAGSVERTTVRTARSVTRTAVRLPGNVVRTVGKAGADVGNFFSNRDSKPQPPIVPVDRGMYGPNWKEPTRYLTGPSSSPSQAGCNVRGCPIRH